VNTKTKALPVLEHQGATQGRSTTFATLLRILHQKATETAGASEKSKNVAENFDRIMGGGKKSEQAS
jgi:hypothetical protein